MSRIEIRRYSTHVVAVVPERHQALSRIQYAPGAFVSTKPTRAVPEWRFSVKGEALAIVEAVVAAETTAAEAAASQRRQDAAEGFVPATARQIDYLRDLGVRVAGERISKTQASLAIDLHLSGNGVGSAGLYYRDGSN